MPDECNSPYKSYSSFGANPYFIDLPSLYEAGLLTAEERHSAVQESPYLCEFDRLEAERFSLLALAASRVIKKEREAIESFIANSPYLDKFARFMALRTANGNVDWRDFSTDKVDEDILFAWKFITGQVVRYLNFM